jgi:hypothetical protein
MARPVDVLMFDHGNARAYREQQEREQAEQVAWTEQTPSGSATPEWRRPQDNFTDRTLQRIMNRLDGLERSIARIERNTRP